MPGWRSRRLERLGSRREKAMLTRISTQDVEPTNMDVRLAPRLNLLCGDNGLGKTFLLDAVWWVLTSTWALHEVIPRRGEGVKPEIAWESTGQALSSSRAEFAFNQQEWLRSEDYASSAYGLVVYAKANGGFELFDSMRVMTSRAQRGATHAKLVDSCRFTLSSRAVWEGLSAQDGIIRCNGLIRDWVAWQFQRPDLFALFTRVLAKLSPHPGEVLRPGPPRRVSIEDARDIPTIELAYGNVPVTHASAGMRRILALAYVLVWTWHEHTEAARLRNSPPFDEMTLLIDEVDAHLHPRWQRAILPSLFEVIPELAASLKVQVLASTHAPLVLASVEPLFQEEQDRLLRFGLSGGSIVVEEIPWSKQGDAASWLVSETFGLHQARSREAERAIEAAEAFVRGSPTPPGLDTRDTIHAELLRVLPGHDDFWPRWLVETGMVT